MELRVRGRARARGALVVAAVVALVAGGAVFGLGGVGERAGAAGGSTLGRPADPVVLTGADVPPLRGMAPGLLVAFRYDGGWQQVPVQVDERAYIDLGKVYGGAAVGVPVLSYTDAGTFTGADADPNIDDNDEIVVMAKDAGGAPPAFSEPAGVVANSGVQVSVADVATAASGVVYLFRQDGSLDPAAGAAYVTYAFNLLSGPYLTTYNKTNGPNPENSTASSPYYAHHFGDRWMSDELRVYAGGATGADILDRHKALFAPGNCARSEDTFDSGEGAFIVNKSGPVRALRGYIGANSGPYTQREHVFYERRQDITTFLRVHSIGSVMDFFDYSPDAAGMTYRNSLNLGGVTIDGVPDSVTPGQPAWESVDGAQGSLVIAHGVSTDLAGFAPTSYYLDDTTPDPPVEQQCTGDAFAYGSSGPWVNQAIPCTDPKTCTTPNHLVTKRRLYYGAPGLTAADAQAVYDAASTPLTFAVERWRNVAPTPTPTPPPGIDGDGDGVPDASDNCPAAANADQANHDGNFIGMGLYGKLFDDITRANSDASGDACDSDADNDGLADGVERGALPPCQSASASTDRWKTDSDGDGALDGAECALGYDPSDDRSRPVNSPATGDTDHDGLTDAFEASIGTNAAVVDSDGDRIGDGIEYRFAGTSALAVNTDGDGCGDGRELGSLNGDLQVNSTDQLIVAQSFSYSGSPKYVPWYDFNRDNVINSTDMLIQVKSWGSCP